MTTELRYRTATGPALSGAEIAADATGQSHPWPRRPRRRWIAAGGVAVALGALGMAGSVLVDDATTPETAPVSSLSANADLAPDWTRTTAAPVTAAGPNADLPIDVLRDGASWADPSSTSVGTVRWGGVAACHTIADAGPNADLAPDWTRTTAAPVTAAGPNADLPWDAMGMRSSGRDLPCGRRAPTTQPGR